MTYITTRQRRLQRRRQQHSPTLAHVAKSSQASSCSLCSRPCSRSRSSSGSQVVARFSTTVMARGRQANACSDHCTQYVKGCDEQTSSTHAFTVAVTAFGHGKFVNRIPCDDGWGCAECSGYECDRCDKQIYLDCDVTPDQCGSDDESSRTTRHVCEDCLTDAEAAKYYGFEAENAGACLRSFVV